MDFCRFLRWKGFVARRWSTQQQLAAELAAADASFSCLRTCQPWGPDDQVSSPERCDSGRSCYELSPLRPGSRSLV